MNKMEQLKRKLQDRRSGKVIFLSHCLLNMNARYLGGAFRSCCVNEIVHGAVDRETAIIQMKCPEQQTWGGILKPMMWLAFESKKTFLYRMRPVILPFFLLYTRTIYRLIAREVVHELCDYVKSGYHVIGIVGIDGSPTCGVNRRIEIQQAFDYYATVSMKELDQEHFNRSLYENCLTEGSGIFVEEVKRELNRKRITIPFYSHSLLEEMNQMTDSIWEGIR